MKKKILKELKEEMQLNYLKKEGVLTGYYRGYSLSIGSLNLYGRSYIIVPVKCAEGFGVDRINEFLKTLRKKYKSISLANYEDYRIALNYAPRFRWNNRTKVYLSIINEIIDFCVQNNFVRCCEVCGENNELSPAFVNGVIVSCCGECKLEFKESLERNKEALRGQRSNILGGVIGSFIGALIGSIVWIIIYQLGYIAAIGGLAIAVCSIVGYEKLGGKLNIIGIVVTSVITIIAVFLAQYMSLGLEIYNTYKLDGFTILSSIESVPVFLENSSVSSAFFQDLAIGYFLTLVGSVSYISKTYRERNFKTEIRDVNL
ncbi:hypothetical protein [Clostridium cibarium]|uniref:Uncharacterized protein n=1 Tax=Clostridium cibarium TaxID=2762247 RepID=A0ABR8PZ15_9CLOT|nr:hypothetical protein [Clostridium cibarium]MBD7913411.1 hypothetical protein [Clostridium cibarium]